MRAFFISITLFGALLVVSAPLALAQTPVPDTVTFEKAKVIEILSQTTATIPGTNTQGLNQSLKVEVLEGADAGKQLDVENDYIQLNVGDVFYLRHDVNNLESIDTYAVAEPYRIPTLAFFAGLFVLCLVVFGGTQGVRGLLALIASFFFINYLLLPGILGGQSPELVSFGVAALIIVAGSYITHGINRTTTTAVIGMLLTVAITGLLAYSAIHSARLGGYTGEEVTYLNFDTKGSIDFVGLLFGSLMIGFLGILYDAAISQSIAVEELLSVGKYLTRKEVYKRGLRIGREHIGALVNTLAIAYVGASLPLLLLFRLTVDQSAVITINQELFATEILRILIGSIGLILAVPITTLIAVYMLYGKKTPHHGGEGHSHGH
jgi:uncharacterized membrane protein